MLMFVTYRNFFAELTVGLTINTRNTDIVVVAFALTISQSYDSLYLSPS